LREAGGAAVTPLLVAAAVVVALGATGTALRRSLELRRSARRQRQALATLGSVSIRSSHQAVIPEPVTGLQAHVRLVAADAEPPLPAPRPLTGGWRPTRATGAAPFRRPVPPSQRADPGMARMQAEAMPGSLLDYAVAPEPADAVRIVRADGPARPATTPQPAGSTSAAASADPDVEPVLPGPLADPPPPPETSEAPSGTGRGSAPGGRTVAASPGPDLPPLSALRWGGMSDPSPRADGLGSADDVRPDRDGCGGDATQYLSRSPFADEEVGARPTAGQSRAAAKAAPLRFDDLDPDPPEACDVQPGASPVVDPDERRAWATRLAAAPGAHARAQGASMNRTAKPRRPRGARPATAGGQAPGRNRLLAAGAAALVLVGAGAAVSTGLVARHRSRPETVQPRSARPVPRATVTTPAPRAVSVPVRLLSSNVGVSVYRIDAPTAQIRLVASGPCWVQIRSGGATGTVLYSQTMQAGQTESASGPLWMRLGNPTAVKVSVDGVTVSPPVTSGNPYDLVFQ
jgi:hypothetical protein